MAQLFDRVLKPIIIIGLVYLAFALLVSTLPFLRLPKASGEGPSPEVNETVETAIGRDRVVLVENRTDAWNARMALLDEATETLDIVYHTVHADSCGHAFWGEVIRAADKGVTVRILLDGKVGASSRDAKKAIRLLDGHPNVTCKRYNPVHMLRPWQWHALLHDKFIIMDGEYALLGGRNVGDRYYGPAGYTGELVEDRDVMVLGNGAEGSVLPVLQDYMEQLWNSPDSVPYSRRHKEDEAGLSRLRQRAILFQSKHQPWYAKRLQDYASTMDVANKVTLLHNPIHTAQKEPQLAKALQAVASKASHSILVQTPYMTANPALLDAARQADSRVPVVLETNSMASSPNCIAFSNYHANRQAFLDTNTQIYEYQGTGSIHGKSMIFDGEISAVGSLNLDDRSFYIDTESMLLIDCPAFAQKLTGAVEALQAQSIQVNDSNQYVQTSPVMQRSVSRAKQTVMFLASKIMHPFRFLI